MSAEGFAEIRSAIAWPATAVPEMVELMRRKAPRDTGGGSD